MVASSCAETSYLRARCTMFRTLSANFSVFMVSSLQDKVGITCAISVVLEPPEKLSYKSLVKDASLH